MTTRALAVTLYRNLMKQATTMSDYNFRSYAIRRVRVGYQKNRTVTGDHATAAIHEGQQQLDVLTRQSVISRMYPSAASVMDNTPTAISGFK